MAGGGLAHVEDGRLVKVEGDPDHPWNRGRLCARCLAMTQYTYNPRRLTQPLKRVGVRVEGKWAEISWDEAFDLIETRRGAIREVHGPESVIFGRGTGRDIGPWICLLAYAYGSPNVMFSLSGIACCSPRIAGVEVMQGDHCILDVAQWLPDRYDDPRYENPEGVAVWGYNIPASCPDNVFGHWIIDLMKRGSKIITLDRLPGFQTDSGLIEIFSSLREECGLDPLPDCLEPPFTPVSRPELLEEYPLILSTGRRSPVRFHSEHRMIPWLRQHDPDPVVEVHPEAAKRFEIADGEWVWRWRAMSPSMGC